MINVSPHDIYIAIRSYGPHFKETLKSHRINLLLWTVIGGTIILFPMAGSFGLAMHLIFHGGYDDTNNT